MRILAVGWDVEGPGVIQARLPEANSLASFDAVLIDPEPIPALWQSQAQVGGDGIWRLYPDRDLGLSRALERLFGERRDELSDLLHRGGGVVMVRVRPPGEGVEVTPPNSPPRRLDRYSFLPRLSLLAGPHHLAIPQGVRFISRRGRDIATIDLDHLISPYLVAFRELGYEAVLTSVLGAPLEAFGRVLAKNRVGDVLALDLPVGNGHLIFLPAFPMAEPARAGELILPALSALLDAPLAPTAPEWLSRYQLPGEEELAERAREVERERERIARAEEELAQARRDYDALRGLLWPRGAQGLAAAARAAFLRLGFSCYALPDDPRSFIATVNRSEALVRVAFSPFAPVGPEEHRSLLLSLDRLHTEERRDVQGLLIAAAETGLDPRRRGPQWQEAVRLGCEEHKLGLVSAYDLFRAVAHVLAGGEAARIRDGLLSSAGEWRWKE